MFCFITLLALENFKVYEDLIEQKIKIVSICHYLQY